MGDFNQLVIKGRLGADPIESQTKRDTAMVRFRVAVNDRKDEDPQWFDVVAFGKTAEFVGQFIRKGDSVVVAGAVKLNSYEGRDGETRHTLSVLADKVVGDGSSGGNDQRGNRRDDRGRDDGRERRDDRRDERRNERRNDPRGDSGRDDERGSKSSKQSSDGGRYQKDEEDDFRKDDDDPFYDEG